MIGWHDRHIQKTLRNQNKRHIQPIFTHIHLGSRGTLLPANDAKEHNSPGHSYRTIQWHPYVKLLIMWS